MLRINNNQCIKLVINIKLIHDAWSEKCQAKRHREGNSRFFAILRKCLKLQIIISKMPLNIRLLFLKNYVS
jgi:hypothetical protein